MGWLQITVGIIEGVVPWLLLFLVIFRRHLRFSPLRTVCYVLLYLSLLDVVIISFPTAVGPERAHIIYQSIRFIVSIAHTCLTSAICLFFVTGLRRRLLLFFILIIKNYLDTLQLLLQIMSDFIKLDPLLFKAILFLATAPLVYLFICRLLRPIAAATSNMEFWNTLWLIPSIFFFLFRLRISPWYLPLGGLNETFQNLAPLIWFFVTFISYYLVLYMLSETLKHRRLSDEVRISQLQSDLRKKQYQQDIIKAAELEQEISQPLSHLEHLARENDVDGIRSYIANHLNLLSQSSGLPVCKNYTADTVLRHYMSLARQNHIRTTVKAQAPAQIFLSEVELSILLGNLLENAFQACMCQVSGQRFLKASLYISENKLLLSVHNSFDGDISENEDGFVSSSHDGNGLGTISVKNIAEKYDGSVSFDHQDHKFTVKVLLQNPDTKGHDNLMKGSQL